MSVRKIKSGIEVTRVLVLVSGIAVAAAAVILCFNGVVATALSGRSKATTKLTADSESALSDVCTAIHVPSDPPFAPDTLLEPHISAATVDRHFRAHQAGYVKKLNMWIAEASVTRHINYPEDRDSSVVVELIRETPAGSPVNNLASQIFNHALYFASLRSPVLSGSNEPDPSSALGQALQKEFGSFEAFWKLFKQKSIAHFGSGWVWLIHNITTDRLIIVDTHDAATPIAPLLGAHECIPLVVCDVWEHAYYLDYKQQRDLYLESWRQVVDWKFVDARFLGRKIEYQGDRGYPNVVPSRFL